MRLLNSGNLVLTDDKGHLWDSFKLPPDTLLPRMTLEKKTLISWGNHNNPETGNFVFEEAGSEYRKIYRIWNQTQIYWESGEIFPKPLLYLLNSGKISSLFRSLYYPSLDDYRNIRLLMNSSGEIQLLKWDREFQWVKIWWKLYDVCNVNDYRGNFTTCNRYNWNQCKCLPGFSPRLGNGDGEQFKGCLRKSQCSTTNNDMFIHLSNIIVKNPDTRIFTKS